MSKSQGLTMSEILELPAMQEAHLLTGMVIEQPLIQQINIMADPEILEWVAENEMLVMTAYSLAEAGPEERLKFFRSCHRLGVAAIAIKLKPYLEALDAEVVSFLMKAGLPVIEVPAEVPISLIISQVTGLLFQRQTRVIERLESIHQGFTDILLSGGGQAEIIAILADYINDPVVFEISYSRDIISDWRNLGQEEQEIIRSDYDRFQKSRMGSRQRSISRGEFSHDGRTIQRVSIPIVLRNDTYGYLTAWSWSSQLNSYDLSIMEAATTILSLIIMQFLSVREVEIKYASEFFEDIISEDPAKRKRAVETYSYFNLRADDSYAVLKADLMAEEDVPPESINLAVRRLIHFLSPELENLKYRYDLEGVIATRANGLQILLSFSDPKDHRPVMDHLAGEIRRVLSGYFPGFRADLGAGRLKRSYQEIRDSHHEAAHAIGISIRRPEGEVLFYDDLGIYTFLYHEGMVEETADFARSILGPLEDYDDRMKDQLFETLESYFRCSGNLTEMSRELFLHYNSVLYRLGRIREILALDLDDADQRLNLSVALKIRELERYRATQQERILTPDREAMATAGNTAEAASEE